MRSSRADRLTRSTRPRRAVARPRPARVRRNITIGPSPASRPIPHSASNASTSPECGVAVSRRTRLARRASRSTAAARSGATAHRWASSTTSRSQRTCAHPREHLRLLDEVDRRHGDLQQVPGAGAGQRRPGLPSERSQVDERGGETETLAEFPPPLDAEPRRAEDQRVDQFGARVQVGEDHARLDRLAEANLVGEQQPGHAARRRQGRLELVVEQVDAGGRHVSQMIGPAIVGEQRAQAEHPLPTSDQARPGRALGGLHAVERREQRPPDAEVRRGGAHQPARPALAVVDHFDDAPAVRHGPRPARQRPVLAIPATSIRGLVAAAANNPAGGRLLRTLVARSRPPVG